LHVYRFPDETSIARGGRWRAIVTTAPADAEALARKIAVDLFVDAGDPGALNSTTAPEA